MVKVMVTGATGLLGRAVVAELEAQPDVEVLACGYSRAVQGVHRLDLTLSSQVTAFIETHQPDVIVHCAAERRPDISEQNPAAALALNADATRLLTLAASQCGAWLLYVSTDYVFDGTAPPYNEHSATNPVNFYGDSKRQGEMIVTEAKQGFAVLRLPILYGAVETLQESAVMVLLNQLLDENEQFVDDWAVRSPTSTEDIASAIAKMISLKTTGAHLAGHYHFSASDTMSKYQMLLTMGGLLGLNTEHLKPVTSPTDSAKRPHDCSLSCERLASLSIQSNVVFNSGIKKALQQSPVAMSLLKK
ncbi:NAD dependent epimerase/dehydratase family protein [Shewanella piezotolerans WP3]|uniref:dTDP-4-dehydrorhamnose reductase n=1 Tax=Shewanella piezotolerans (strain WP3 / JCM 13877) TaxID=225849 RepID=B8CUP4_SHEPW|nr:SDR family oxidoreductase [Shewanella piezotolerans]ACJ31236.1 NAD dependent epimerase/dehydratase family protein [Shewanella piezotolerans WP3]